MSVWKVPIVFVRGVFSSIFMLWRSLWGPEPLWEGFREASRKIVKFRYHIFSDCGKFSRFWGPPGGAPNRLGAATPKGSKISWELPWVPWKHFCKDWRCQTCFFDFSIDFFIFLHFFTSFCSPSEDEKKKGNAGKPSREKNDRSCSCHLICFNQLQLRGGHWLRQSESAAQL